MDGVQILYTVYPRLSVENISDIPGVLMLMEVPGRLLGQNIFSSRSFEDPKDHYSNSSVLAQPRTVLGQ